MKTINLPSSHRKKSSIHVSEKNCFAKAIMPSFSEVLRANSLFVTPLTVNHADSLSLIPIEQTKKRIHLIIHTTLLCLVFFREMIMVVHVIRVSNSSTFDDFSKIFSQCVSLINFFISLCTFRLLLDRGLVCKIIQSWLDVSKYIGG
jgi:hypothetical protein